MKTRFRSIGCGFCLILCVGARPLSAHETNVHRRISESAAQRSTGLQQFLGEVLSPAENAALNDPNDPSQSPKSPIGWMEYGSGREDDLKAPADQGGYRVLNHFYDPVTRKGLSELP